MIGMDTKLYAYITVSWIARTQKMFTCWSRNYFCEKGENHIQVNHIDGDKYNNQSTNLEWVTAKENTAHAFTNDLRKSHPKKVMQYSHTNEYIAIFDSTQQASEQTGDSIAYIYSKCRGQNNESGKFIWKYVIKDNYDEKCPDGTVVEGYPNYLVTAYGQVYSKHSKLYLIPKIMKSGYKIVSLCHDGTKKDFYLHKLINETLTPNSV